MKINDIQNLSLEQLQIEFMRLSPTYAFVQKMETSGVTGVDRVEARFRFFDENYATLKRRKIAPLNEHRYDMKYISLQGLELKKVKKVYDEFGDISKPFIGWLESSSQAARLYKAKRTRQPTLIGVYKRDPQKIFQRFPRLGAHWLAMKEDTYLVPDSIFLQIPLYATDRDITNFVKEALLEHRDKSLYKQILTPIPLLGQRINSNALHKKLRLMLHKVFAPEEPIWKLAIKANLSKKYADMHKTYTSVNKTFSESDIEILNIMANRALANSQYICENAVRGQFPSMEKVLTPNYDWKSLQKRVLKAWPDLKA